VTAIGPLTIDRDRFAADLEAMNRFGWTDDGMQRTAFSPAHAEARAWLLQRGHDAGLQTAVDGAGNHSVTLLSERPEARTLLIGSHLDSVPCGGRFDGALGVLCALEVVRTVADAGLRLPVTLEAIDFTDEEGTVFPTLGSEALAGALTSSSLASPACGREVLLAALAQADLTEEGLLAARRDPKTLAGFLELHIEQGPSLEREDLAVGIVTGICGQASFELVFQGAARHAGTTPMDRRRDAGLGAAAFALAVRDTVVRDFPGCVATVGELRLHPGASNVVPGRAELSLDCRSLDEAELGALANALIALAHQQAARADLDVRVKPAGLWPPAPTHQRARTAITRSAAALGLAAVEMPSGAGHDAQVLTRIATTGMVFVPSHAGISHHPDESTRLDQCIDGCNVLLGAALDLASDWGDLDRRDPRPVKATRNVSGRGGAHGATE
jgi:beta-ureidopropionase / N-carbamoyl-L-amino-acid hydrolase